MRGMRGAPNDNDNDKPLTEEGVKHLTILVCLPFIILAVLGLGCFIHAKLCDQGIIKSSDYTKQN